MSSNDASSESSVNSEPADAEVDMTEQLYKEGMEHFKKIIDEKDMKIKKLKIIISNSDLDCRRLQHDMSEIKGMLHLHHIVISKASYVIDELMEIRDKLDVSDYDSDD